MCVEWRGEAPHYSFLRSVPAISSHGNMLNRPWEDKIRLPVKMHLDGSQGRFGQTYGLAGPTVPPLATAFLWVTAWWVLVSGSRCRGLVGRFGLSSGSFFIVLHRMRSSVGSPAYSLCFLFRTCAPEKTNSPKQLWS